MHRYYTFEKVDYLLAPSKHKLQNVSHMADKLKSTNYKSLDVMIKEIPVR